MAVESEFQQKFITWDKGIIVIVDPLLWGIRNLCCQWHRRYLISSTGTLKNRSPGSYSGFWKMRCFSGCRLFVAFSNLSYSTLIISSAQAVFTSLPIFSSRACFHLLQILNPADTCPSSAPNPDSYSRLINLSIFRLPWSDVNNNGEGMREETRQSSCHLFWS